METIWEGVIREYMPRPRLESPFPYDSFRKLYAAHHPYWFLMKHKVWIGDSEHMGKVMVIGFDPPRACIEGYQLVASKRPVVLMHWALHPIVYVAQFQPTVGLHFDRRLLQLNPKSPEWWWEKYTGPPGLEDEIHMPPPDLSKTIQSATFMTTKAFPSAAQHSSAALWPTMRIPSHQRVRNASGAGYRDSGHKPKDLASICENAFRIRHRSQLTSLSRVMGVFMGETVTTYAALQAHLYTPTVEKPWRGIWVGDYAGHSCEFLLIHQPDEERENELSGLTNDLTLDATSQSPSDSIHPASQIPNADVDIYKGRLEAIKLTGDANVPRGEYSFIVDDLGPSGLLRIADEEPFVGARVLRSKGQIAESHGFNNGKERYLSPESSLIYDTARYIDTQLIMISTNRLAHYWIELNHVNFFERVKIDDIVPYP